jgi:NlpC/P60 family putative phage cell wall peptidase
LDGSIAAPSRVSIVAEARSWLGTPYQHQASIKGAGCDCLGLVRGVWRAFYGGEPERAPPYTPDWAETLGAETLYLAARRNLVAIEIGAARAGDVLLFRMHADAPMKHAAILSAPDRIVHAYWGRAVVESRLSPWWRGRAAAAFSFPGVYSWPS